MKYCSRFLLSSYTINLLSLISSQDSMCQQKKTLHNFEWNKTFIRRRIFLLEGKYYENSIKYIATQSIILNHKNNIASH